LNGGFLLSTSVIDPTTLQAYQETEYRVFADPRFMLRVGVYQRDLAALHDVSGVSSSCFITAWNPLSLASTEAENAGYQAALAHDLGAQRLTFLEGIGQHPSNQWPGEPSFLVLGISLPDAMALGAKYRQNAVVWCGADAIPQLVLLR
jgi:hypothetical protein